MNDYRSERTDEPDAARLRAYEMALNSVAAELAHPLKLIEWNRSFLQEHLRLHGKDYSEQLVNRSLQDIRSAERSMERLVEHYTQLCACLCGTVPVQKVNLDLASMLHSLCADQQAIYDAIGVRLTVDYDPGSLWYTVADPVLVERILLHLLSNALHACSTGGEVVFRLGMQRAEILLTVQDNGCGMSPEQAQSLLSPDEHRYLHTGQFAGGTGMGLRLCSEYCRMLGWTLRITPQQKGVAVQLSVPQHHDVPPAMSLHSPGRERQQVSRIALLRELHSVPGLEELCFEAE